MSNYQDSLFGPTYHSGFSGLVEASNDFLGMRRIITKCTLFFVLQFAISQAGIAARTLPLMQGSEEKE